MPTPVVLVPTRPTRDGVAAPTEVAGDVTNGHVVANSGQTIIGVRNADTASHNVTFVIPGTVDGEAVADRVEAVAASTTRYFGDFTTSIYGSQMLMTVDSAMLKLTAYQP